MKLKNAPGRKNARRIAVLERILAINPMRRSVGQQRMLAVIRKRIMQPADARAIRTKKRR